MATSWVRPELTLMALPAAPVPRPPQPTRASLTVSLPPAWTCGSATPASAVAAEALTTSRRDQPGFLLFMGTPGRECKRETPPRRGRERWARVLGRPREVRSSYRNRRGGAKPFRPIYPADRP